MPIISVIMTTLNSGKFVLEAVQSILNQSCSDFELLVVDGGSDDGTVDILNNYHDKRIQLFVKHGLRRSAQLNFGIEEARGKYIAIIDSDDIALPMRLETQIDFLQHRQDIGLVGSWAELVTENGTFGSVLKRPTEHDAIVRHLLTFGAPSFGTTMWRKEIWDRRAHFHEELQTLEEIEWYLRIMPFTRFANIPVPLTRLRQTKNSRSRNPRTNHDPSLIVLLEGAIKGTGETLGGQATSFDITQALGIAHYYYGSFSKARQHLLLSFRRNPKNLLTLRYALPIFLVPSAVLSMLRSSRLMRSLARAYRAVVLAERF